jgi:hypothetical protein
VAFSVEKRRLFCLRYASSPSHTVGTPALIVTPSVSNSSKRLLPSRCGPGKTIFAPTMVHEYGRLQALTWNIGTTGSTTSRAERLSVSGSAAA